MDFLQGAYRPNVQACLQKANIYRFSFLFKYRNNIACFISAVLIYSFSIRNACIRPNRVERSIFLLYSVQGSVKWKSDWRKKWKLKRNKKRVREGIQAIYLRFNVENFSYWILIVEINRRKIKQGCEETAYILDVSFQVLKRSRFKFVWSIACAFLNNKKINIYYCYLSSHNTFPLFLFVLRNSLRVMKHC